MFPDILTESQKAILPHLESFTSDYYLVGGTAIALYLGHRKSINFDLFKYDKIKLKSIKKWKEDLPVTPINTIYESSDQIHFIIGNVKVTFMQFPFQLKSANHIHGLSMPSLLSLAAMKAYALGGRAKWKDYVDLYFIMKDHYSIKEIIKKADELFGSSFNGRFFRQQLSYFDDINYTEKVEYVGEDVQDHIITEFLTEISYSPF
jgi:hypothetical protein